MTCRPEYFEAGHVSHGYAMTVHEASQSTGRSCSEPTTSTEKWATSP